MFGKVGANVTPGQKVAQNQKEPEAKRPFVIVWKKTSATINETVKIEAVANIAIKDAALISIDVLFDGKPFGKAEKITVNQNLITAEWKVKARNSGNYTAGVYDAEIRYNNGVPGRTKESLSIVAVNRKGDYFG